LYYFVMPRGLHRTYGAYHLHSITCSCHHRLPLLCTASSREPLPFDSGTDAPALSVSWSWIMLSCQSISTFCWLSPSLELLPRWCVRTTKTRVEKLRYIHRNPVGRGLVESPEEWRWSSYRSYLLDEAGPYEW